VQTIRGQAHAGGGAPPLAAHGLGQCKSRRGLGAPLVRAICNVLEVKRSLAESEAIPGRPQAPLSLP